MIWSVPAAIKWIRGLEKFDLQYVEQPVPDFDLAGMATVRRAVGVPIAADEGCTDVRSALELIKAEACDVFVVYPSEAGGLTRARQIAALADAAGKWCAIGSWAELGVATMANAHLVASSTSFVVRERHALSAAGARRAHRARRDGEWGDRGRAMHRASASSSTPTRSSDSQTFRCESPSSTTTSRVRPPGSVRSSDADNERRTWQCPRTTQPRARQAEGTHPSRPAGQGRGRRRPAPSRPGRSRAPQARRSATRSRPPTPIRRGGRLIWALEQDPVHVAPYGAILTSNHWGKQAAYDSLVEWDKQPEPQAGARDVVEDRRPTRSRSPSTCARASSSTTARSSTPTTSKYSVEKMLNPPLPGSITTVSQVPAIRRGGRRLEVRGSAAT